MPDSGLHQVLARVRRRLSYAHKCLPEAPIVWHDLERTLGKCSSWGDLEAWARALPSWLEGSPLHAYALTAARRKSGTARLIVGAADVAVVPASELGTARARKLHGAVAEDAFAWGQEALMAWEPWAPHLDQDLYQLEFEGPWPTAGQGPPVSDVVARLLANDTGCALALQYYTGNAYLLDFNELQGGWQTLFAEGGDDWLVLPVSRPPAAWALCYFHHAHLEVGRLRGQWVHNAPILP